MSRAWKWLRYHGVSIWAALAIAYLLVPIALIAVFSFVDPEGKFNYIWNGFTTEHWKNIFGIEELTDDLPEMGRQTSERRSRPSSPRSWAR